jgi:nucleotide-binding universal stress UspA family protein
MSKPILTGFDARSADRAPVRFGAVIARVTHAPLMIVSVQADPLAAATGAPVAAPLPLGEPQETVAFAPGEVDEDLVDDSAAALEDIEAEVRAWGLNVDYVRMQGASAARALHEAAQRNDAGLLVVGSSLREGRVLGGSTAERLLHGAPCAVGVVPPNWTADGSPRVIGVAYVTGDEGLEALRNASALARRAGATLRVLSVVKPNREDRDLEEAIRQIVAVLAADVPVEVEIDAGDPAETLIGLSASLDVLVCGSRGYGPLRATLLGSVSRRLVVEARCPVIVLPRGVKASLESLVEASAGTAPRA